MDVDNILVVVAFVVDKEHNNLVFVVVVEVADIVDIVHFVLVVDIVDIVAFEDMVDTLVVAFHLVDLASMDIVLVVVSFLNYFFSFIIN